MSGSVCAPGATPEPAPAPSPSPTSVIVAPSAPPVRVDLHQLRNAATVIFSSIAFIEATIAAIAEQPAALAVGLVKLPPIIDDLGRLARSCLAAAANYEHNESSLIPELEKALTALVPIGARAAVAISNTAGLLDTSVAVRKLEASVGRAATDIGMLMQRLLEVGRVGEIRIEVSAPGQAVPGGRPGRHFTLYLPGTQSWSLKPGHSVFDLRSDLGSLADAGPTAAERATRNSLEQAGFGSQDTLTVVGYSPGALVGADLIARGVSGRVLGLVSVGAPIDAIQLPDSVEVINIQHSNDPVPMLDLTQPPDKANWLNLNLGPGGLIGHSLESYVNSLDDLGTTTMAGLKERLSGLLDQGQVEIQDWSARRTY